MISETTCQLFDIPFFQFVQLKKYCPEDIPRIKADYKREWNEWKDCILQVSTRLGSPFAEPHIEKWCNGWQVRAHFFAYFKYEFNRNSAAILSVLLNRRRLQVSLDWHCYRADRSQIDIRQYNQWLTDFDFRRFADFDVWRGDESEYANFRRVKQLTRSDLNLRSDDDFWRIGKNVEKNDLEHLDAVDFITLTIRELLPLYEKCHR